MTFVTTSLFGLIIFKLQLLGLLRGQSELYDSYAMGCRYFQNAIFYSNKKIQKRFSLYEGHTIYYKGIPTPPPLQLQEFSVYSPAVGLCHLWKSCLKSGRGVSDTILPTLKILRFGYEAAPWSSLVALSVFD